MKATTPLWRYRIAVASRATAAIAGGYALAASATAALALLLAWFWLPVEAVMAATLLSWGVYAGAVAWVFYARTWWGAWLGVLAPAAMLASAAALPRLFGGAA